MAVLIPGKAVDSGADLSAPTVQLLHDLNLLPTEKERDDATGAGSAFGKSEQAVSIIEAGATSLSKWWAVALGGSGAALWASIKVFWSGLATENQGTLILSVAIVSFALVGGLSFIVASDVRGRASAMVATVNARSTVTDAMTRAAVRLYDPAPPALPAQIIALPIPLPVTNLEDEDSSGWLALAVDVSADEPRYLIARGKEHKWLAAKWVKVD